MKIVLATANKHKIEEIKTYLTNVEVLPLPLGEAARRAHGTCGASGAVPRAGVRGNIDLKEEGSTLRENARQKARTEAEASGLWSLADDTGLFVDALDGRPGVYSARYAGPAATFDQNIDKLLLELKEFSLEKRSARFVTVMALVHPDGREVTVQGDLAGVIVDKRSGDKGFGYDPVFWLPDRHCTLAELSLEEKNKISHRGTALLKMRVILEEMIKLGV